MAPKKEVLEILKKVDDPEIGISVVDMGFIDSIKLEKGRLEVEMLLTTPFCPMANVIVSSVKSSLESSKKFKSVEVHINFDKQWTPERMSNEAKHALGFE